MQTFSQIDKSASIKSPEGLEHPVHLSPLSEVHAGCTVGRYTHINIGTVLFSHVKVGRFTSFGRNCEIGAANHPLQYLSTHTFQIHAQCFPRLPDYKNLKRKPWLFHPDTHIGNDVWVGAKTVVRAGVTIGDGAVVAAGSVVTKDIPPYTIAGGTPARMIRMRFPSHIVAALLELKWWELNIVELDGLPFDNIEACVTELRNRIAKKATESS
ncbi:MAG: CatB-related O-acetyltransferase [Desulfovibrionaceae bacterium]|jgi:acetyltransferase-like isoleucine patch superfamily enzyme|nr:CatB-related O-acetyltransferase [Desulfovibrionaceae bacterium]